MFAWVALLVDIQAELEELKAILGDRYQAALEASLYAIFNEWVSEKDSAARDLLWFRYQAIKDLDLTLRLELSLKTVSQQ